MHYHRPSVVAEAFRPPFGIGDAQGQWPFLPRHMQSAVTVDKDHLLATIGDIDPARVEPLKKTLATTKSSASACRSSTFTNDW